MTRVEENNFTCQFNVLLRVPQPERVAGGRGGRRRTGCFAGDGHIAGGMGIAPVTRAEMRRGAWPSIDLARQRTPKPLYRRRAVDGLRRGRHLADCRRGRAANCRRGRVPDRRQGRRLNRRRRRLLDGQRHGRRRDCQSAEQFTLRRLAIEEQASRDHDQPRHAPGQRHDARCRTRKGRIRIWLCRAVSMGHPVSPAACASPDGGRDVTARRGAGSLPDGAHGEKIRRRPRQTAPAGRLAGCRCGIRSFPWVR